MSKTTNATLADILDISVQIDPIVGRDEELAILHRLETEELPIVTFLYGIPGIGKTALLNTYLNQMQHRAGFAVQIDANRFEPTPLSFRSEIARILKVESDSIVDKLSSINQRVVIAIDNYQAMRLLDRWIRDEFLPGLPANVRLLLATNHRPGPGWRTLSPWNSMSHTIELSPLSSSCSIEFLKKRNFSASQARYVQTISKGYPMALVMASSIWSKSIAECVTESFSSRLMTDLAQAYLATIESEALVSLLKELSLLRRITLPILMVLRPADDPEKLYQDLRKVTFIIETDEGLTVHDAVKEALVVSLNAESPSRVREVKRLVWSLLAGELKQTHDLNLWRFTADTIFLLSDPVIREAFFPKEVPFYDVVPARNEDSRAIRKICSIHEGKQAADLIEMWWNEAPQCFKVILDNFGEVAGFYLAVDPALVSPSLIQRDFLTKIWQAHTQSSRMPSSQRAFFIRRWLSLEHGDVPSPVQAAAWLDLKRSYLEMWPDLRQVYLAVTDLTPYAEIAARLQFKPLDELAGTIDDRTYFGAVLDMGPASVNGWLHRLLARELGIDSHDFLDPERQAVLVEGKPIELTALEFKVAAYLYANIGNAVSRERLLNNIWGHSYEGGSNVVDAVITNLRRKLGEQNYKVQTVRGHGYSLELV